MLALYRAGRQADALDAFRVARSRFVDELGLEPGPDLRELQRRILQHDPDLGAPRAMLPAVARRSGRVLVAAAFLAAAVLVAVVEFAGSSARRPVALPAGKNGVIAVATSAGPPAVSVATVLTGETSGVTAASGSIWVTDASDGTVSRINAATGLEVDRIAVGGNPASIAAGDGAVWVANTDGATVLRIDPTSETVSQVVHLGGANPDALAFGAGRLWAADSSARSLFEIDPTTGRVAATIALGVSPSAIAYGRKRLWVAGYDTATILSLDVASRRVVGQVRVGAGPSSLTFAAGDLWVANSLDSTVSRIDPLRPRVRATIPVGSGPAAIVLEEGYVWVANQYSGTVSRIDPRRDVVTATLTVAGQPVSLVTDHRLWVGIDAGEAGHRGGTLTVASTQTLGSLDPALFNNDAPPQFDGLVYDTLITFDHTSGVAGLRLVPDLALSLPKSTDDGRTYTFHLRPGIRYSNGSLVHAGDFRRALERLFEVGSPGADYYTDIVGASACAARAASCDLSRGVVTNDTAGTIVFHLTTSDPEFLYQLTEQDYTAPVPPGTPDRDIALHPFAGTGPYRIARADQAGVTFARNRRFREWSHAAQPAGNPNTIVWRNYTSVPAATAAVRDGRADWLNGLIAPSDYGQIEIQSPVRLHTHVLSAVDFLTFNTRLAPFDKLQARRALNDAIDRTKIARLYGGPAFATPTCQVFTPGLPGYRRYCPYTRNPASDGSYGGPALAQSRRLVSASGTRGDRVAVLGSTDEGFIPPQLPEYVASVLRTLGYRATVHLMSTGSIFGEAARFPLSTNGDWLTDYPDPSSYIPSFFACDGDGNDHLFCDPALDREIRRAEALELDAPRAAATLWTSIDRRITNEAAWAPTVNPRVIDLVSKRLGNYQFNPVWSFLVDQSWVR